MLQALGETALMMEDRFNRRTAMTEERGCRLTLQLLAVQTNNGAARAGGEIWPVDLVVPTSSGPAPARS